MARPQIGGDVVDGPIAEPAPAVVGDVGREPSLQGGALKVLAGLIAPQEGFRRVTGAAMTWAIDQKSSPIPRGRLLWVGLVFALAEIERVPHAHRRPDIERKRQQVCDDRMPDRLQRIEVGADRQHVAARHLGVGVERHGGIEPRAVRAHSPAEGGLEGVIAPGADAGLAVRGYVWWDYIAQRRLDRSPAREGPPAAGNRMAGGAVGGDRKIAAALDLGEILRIGFRPD